jgi:hypothetical protein
MYPDHLPWQGYYYNPAGRRGLGRTRKGWKEQFNSPLEFGPTLATAEDEEVQKINSLNIYCRLEKSTRSSAGI